MDHPYRNADDEPVQPPVPVEDLRRVGALLALVVGILLFLVIVFALFALSFGLRFAVSVPGLALVLLAVVLAFLALSLPFQGILLSSGLVLRFLYGTRKVSWEDFRHGRRSVLNVDLLRGETALLLVAFRVKGSPTRLCLLPLTGRRREQTDLWSAGSYETAVDQRLREFESKAKDQRS